MWIDENTVPSVVAYGADYKYFEAPHSGHALQNDDKIYEQYMNAVEEYLNKYMPVK